jgi:hypothetical protein
MADRPHHISLALAIIALVVSCLSWWESHQGRIINEEANRPVLSVAGIETDAGATRLWKSPDIPLTVVVRLKNTGRVTARITEAKVEPDQFASDIVCETRPDPNDALGYLNRFERVKPWTYNPREMLVGVEESISGMLVLSRACLEVPLLKIVVTVTVRYVDVASGKEFSQNFDDHIEVYIDQLKAKAKNKYGTDFKSWPPD